MFAMVEFKELRVFYLLFFLPSRTSLSNRVVIFQILLTSWGNRCLSVLIPKTVVHALIRAASVAERLRRYVQVVVNFVGVGSIPTGRTFFSRSSILVSSMFLAMS